VFTNRSRARRRARTGPARALRTTGRALAALLPTATLAAQPRTTPPPVVSAPVEAPALAPQAAAPTAADLLDALVREALTRNLALARRDAETRQATSAVRQARGVLLPTLGLDARYSEFSGVVNIGDFINPAYAALNQLLGQNAFPTDVAATLPFRQDTRLKAIQLLYSPAAIEQWRLARTLQGVSQAQRDQAARDLAADVQLAWLGLAGAARVVDVYDAALALAEEHVRVAERLTAADQGTVDAVYRARADRDEVLQQRDDAGRQRDAARRTLNLLLDRDVDEPVPLADDSTLVRPLPTSRDALLAAAPARREEIRQASLGVDAAHRQQQLAGASFLPTLALAGEWGIQGDRYRFDGSGNVALASLVLQWNLFNGGQDDARREQATLERRKADLRLRESERFVARHVADAWDAAQVAARALNTAASRVEAARRAFTLTARRYEEGLAPYVEYVAARTTLTQAELNAVLARYGYAARRVELERAAALRTLTP
jgi:outer membrane protein TolC